MVEGQNRGSASLVAENPPFVVEKRGRGAERWKSIREGINFLNGCEGVRTLGGCGMRDRGGSIRVEGMQDDDNCRETAGVRNAEWACMFQIEIVIVCFFERGG
jgi:hypothetical protein